MKSKSASGKTQWKANQISFWPFPLSSLETEADLYERRISTRKVQAGTFLLSLAQVTHSRSPAPASALVSFWGTRVTLKDFQKS